MSRVGNKRLFKVGQFLNSFKRMLLLTELIENWPVFVKGGNQKKKISAQVREPTTQPTYNAGCGNRIQATTVRGERSHRCVIAAPESSQNVYSWIVRNIFAV